jgi:hypothetical protein
MNIKRIATLLLALALAMSFVLSAMAYASGQEPEEVEQPLASSCATDWAHKGPHSQ